MANPKYSGTDRLLALGGLYMAVNAVQQIAQQGNVPATQVETLIYSLFQIDSTQVADVYQDAPRVITGLQCLCRSLPHNDDYYFEQNKFVMTLIHLERKLMAQPKLLQQIRTGLENARQQTEHFHFNLIHPNVLANLADLYKQTISTLPPRILVNGNPLHLQNPDNANKIRALLLAGIRSAVLWRQCGGNRFTLLFRSASLRKEAQQLIESLIHEQR